MVLRQESLEITRRQVAGVARTSTLSLPISHRVPTVADITGEADGMVPAGIQSSMRDVRPKEPNATYRRATVCLDELLVGDCCNIDVARKKTTHCRYDVNVDPICTAQYIRQGLVVCGKKIYLQYTQHTVASWIYRTINEQHLAVGRSLSLDQQFGI